MPGTHWQTCGGNDGDAMMVVGVTMLVMNDMVMMLVMNNAVTAVMSDMMVMIIEMSDAGMVVVIL